MRDQLIKHEGRAEKKLYNGPPSWLCRWTLLLASAMLAFVGDGQGSVTAAVGVCVLLGVEDILRNH